jgi:hypothetical protein
MFDDEPITYKLRFHTYSGMQIPLTTGEMDEVRAYAANYLWTRRRGYEVTILQRGIEWEVQTRANIEGFIVTDEDGILKIH